ncbi:MAG TPA: RDD family protein [Acidothermaceae bacterium]|nr:RDD family protein [Acidothermaceae bacterium]
MADVGRVSGSWLDGPGGGTATADAGAYVGERLGLPPRGARSVAGLGARLGALCIDWLIAVLITSPFTGHRPFTPGSNSPWVLAVFAAEYIVLVSLIGRTIGMRLCGIGIMRLDGRRLSLPWVVVRTALLVLVVPAVIYDRDRRGLHDKAAGSIVVRL